MSLAEELPVERLLELRRRGWSFELIARLVRVQESRLREYAQGVLPAQYLGRVTRQDVVGWLLDDGWTPGDVDGLAAQADCKRWTVMRVLRRWKLSGKWTPEGRCSRCQMQDEPGNPVDESELCQWCRWEAEGYALREVYESGMAARVNGHQLEKARKAPHLSCSDRGAVRTGSLRINQSGVY